MVIVRELIETRGLTQIQAAKLFGVSQPRISDLVRGKIGLFSIDTLVDMLASGGVRVDISVPQLAWEPSTVSPPYKAWPGNRRGRWQ